MNLDQKQLMVTQGEGRLVHLGGIGVHYKIPSAQTGATFSIVEHPVEPGTLVPPHVHTREDELSFVVEGEFGVRIGERVFTATPGCYVVKPRNIPHTFWNAGKKRARLVEIIFPAGFEQYFAEMAQLFPANGGPPDFGEVAELGGRYGLSFYMDWVPELEKQYKVKLLGG
ncbi:MAG TPA: cupin domain-containing protein [Dehalococcoidia bacterium]|nr:cupin domain-containing protein [Dehalococcoidia bacterium]